MSDAPRGNGAQHPVRKVYPLEDLCMGCGLREVYCLAEHSRTGCAAGWRSTTWAAT